MSKSKTITVTQLYPDQMNIYGDNGNAQILCYRLQQYGYKPVLQAYNSSADREKLIHSDLVVGGGGQDSGQRAILSDLQLIKPDLLSMAADKVPMLMICGLYQLFGHYFQTKDGDKLDGIGLFDMVTIGGNKRLIGNATIESDDFGVLVGYENHSGVTTLGDNQAALGQVVMGYGNDGTGVSEGARRYCVMGTYLHGPVLSKNPVLADWLIQRSLEHRYGITKLRPVDNQSAKRLTELDKLIAQARSAAEHRQQ